MHNRETTTWGGFLTSRSLQRRLTAKPDRREPSIKILTWHQSHLWHPPFTSLHHHCACLGAEISARLDVLRCTLLHVTAGFRTLHPLFPLFTATSTLYHHTAWAAAAPGGPRRHAFDVALSPEYVARTLVGTRVYTVRNSNNEFVLISDPNNSLKSLGLLCFRQEDAQSLLAQVQLWQPVLERGARVVPITLD